jgi:hypothetical protein
MTLTWLLDIEVDVREVLQLYSLPFFRLQFIAAKKTFPGCARGKSHLSSLHLITKKILHLFFCEKISTNLLIIIKNSIENNQSNKIMNRSLGHLTMTTNNGVAVGAPRSPPLTNQSPIKFIVVDIL